MAGVRASRSVRQSLLALAARRLGVAFPPRFAKTWVDGVEVEGRSTPSAWRHVVDMVWPGGDPPPHGVGFPVDGDPDFDCLVSIGGALSEVVYTWSHESRRFTPIEPAFGAHADPPIAAATPPQDDAIRLAIEIEEGAFGRLVDWAGLFAAYAAATGTTMSAEVFQARCETDPAPVLEPLLFGPRAPVAAPGELTRDQLVELVARAHELGVDTERAIAALVARTELPGDMASDLASGHAYLPGGWPSAEAIVDFALEHRAVASVDDVWKLARAWAEDTAHARVTVPSTYGEALLRAALERFDVPDLAELLRARTDGRRRQLRERLGLAFAPPPVAPTAAPEAPPPKPARVRHKKFGEGTVLGREGAGSSAKLTIAFESGTKVLQASFVEFVDPTD